MSKTELALRDASDYMDSLMWRLCDNTSDDFALKSEEDKLLFKNLKLTIAKIQAEIDQLGEV